MSLTDQTVNAPPSDDAQLFPDSWNSPLAPGVSWKGKVGLIVPSWNTMSEYEFPRLLPPEVSVHVTRIEHLEDSRPAFEYMNREAPGTVKLLSHARVDTICYACTAASFMEGAGAERALAATLTQHAGIPVYTMAGSLAAAARSLGLQKVVVAAPYEKWLLDLLVAFLEENGFTVLRSAGLDRQANITNSPREVYQLVKNAYHPEADGLVVSCGNFRTLGLVDRLEEAFSKPVVTSNHAAVWMALRNLGISAGENADGKLLRSL